ncbi:MAG: hypothetical protein R2695_04005 [Acidimicrobiales bacterium]
MAALMPARRLHAVADRPKTLRLAWDGPFSLVNARSGHWWANHAEDQMLRQWAAMAGTDEGIHFTGPVQVEAMMTIARGVLPDCGAISLAVKHVIDGLVDAGVLPDDNSTHVISETYHAPERTGRRSLIVLVKDADAS